MPTNDYAFYLSHASYKRTRLLAWLLVWASLTVAIICALISVRLWSLYTHIYTVFEVARCTTCYLMLYQSHFDSRKRYGRALLLCIESWILSGYVHAKEWLYTRRQGPLS